MSPGRTLVEASKELWARIPAHPFVVAAADGSLPDEAFGRWLVEDHFFVVGFRRFLARLVATAPGEAARDVLAGALSPLQAELDLFREEGDGGASTSTPSPTRRRSGTPPSCRRRPTTGGRRR